MATKPEVISLLNLISEAFPSFELTPGRIDLYADLLGDLDTDALKAAVKQHIAASKFPPTIAELREACLGLTRPHLPTWADAWEDVLSEIRRVGHTGTPRFRHALIDQAVQGMGGWQLMCEMPISETSTWRAQFRDVYSAYASRAESVERLIPAARALAIKTGALPAPAEPDPPALPEPASEPTALGEFIDFAARLRQWREEGMKARSDNGRKIAEEAANG